jgi:aminomethyltransferase
MSGGKRTPLYVCHLRHGARMVEFAGFELPVHYTSILEEHAAVREAAGIFDVSHMGQLALEGPAALAAADALLSRRISTLAPGRVRYALLCNEGGGVVDDVTAYRTGPDALFLCVNASNVEKDDAWIQKHLPAGVRFENQSDATALIALQGPASGALLRRVGSDSLLSLRRFEFARSALAGRPALVSRTGYTGADGFELYCASSDAETLFEALLEAGAPLGARPCGLGARDTLRLEAALPLYGHELDDTTSPLEAGLDRFVEKDGAFLGAAAIRERERAGHPRVLVGFVLVDRGVARAGYPVAQAGREIGVVTSGAPSPTLGKSIGLAYVPPASAAPGTGIQILMRGRAMRAQVVLTPFVRGDLAGSRPRT